MSNKFLNSLHGESLSVLTTGTASLYLKSLKINDLEDSKNVVTDDKFLTTGSGASELTFINSDDHTSPNVGISKIYFKTDGNLYKKNNLGEESTLAGGYGLITVPEDELNDIDYKTDYDGITWTNTSLDTYNFYNYYAAPLKPSLRTPFVPLDNRATNVFSEGDLDLAITDEKDNIFIATDFSITSSKFITFPCKIYGDSLAKPTITADGISTSLFNVSSDNVFFENLILENANTSSNCNCIYFGFNGEAKNNCVHNCVLRTNEFAINSDHYQVQIYNNAFEFVGTPDSHRYIYLSRCLGEVLIYENTFGTNGTTGSPNTACMLINSPNGSSAFDGGHLVIYKNNSVGVIQRMAIMETEPVNFKLSLLENTIETNTDFFILYGATMLNGFTEIIAYKNTVTLLPTSLGFKGLVGWDSPSGGDITYCPIVRGSLNNLPINLRVDYSPLPNLGNILCYKNTVFTTSLTVPLNPNLVAIGEISQGITGPVSSVDNSIVFFDGITGQVIKENNNFKFVTGATYGDQLKVPDIETDDHLSINEELTTMDTAITTNTAKLVNQTAIQSPNPITTLVGELDVAKIKSYEHNCELQFDNTNAILTADNIIALNGVSINLNGVSTTDQTSFTQDQQIVSKKYVDDANTNQNTVISTNTAANIGSVTVHSDVSNAGSGAIITTAERTAIGSNTTKTTNIISTNNNNTVFNGSLECGTVYLDNIRPMGNNGGEIYVYKQNGALGLKFDTDGNFSVPSGNVSANSVIVNGTTPITDGGSGSIITTAERTAIGSNTTKTQNITATAGATTLAGTTTANFIKNNYLQIGSGASSLYMVASNLSNIAEYKDDRDVKFYGNVRVDNDITTTNLIVDATDTEDHGVTTTNLITGVVLRVRKPDGSIIMDINGSAFSTKDVRFFGDVNVDGGANIVGRLTCSNIKQGWFNSSSAGFIYQDDLVNFIWDGAQLQFTKVNTSIPNYWTFTNQTLKNSDVGTLSRFESGGYSANSPSWFTHADPGYDANYDLVGNKLGIIDLTLIAYQDTTLKSYSIKIISSYGTPSLSYLINVMPGS